MICESPGAGCTSKSLPLAPLTVFLMSSLALIVGALIPIQAATNAAMGKVIGSSSLVALVMFATGFVFLLTLVLLTRPEWPSLSAYRTVPSYGYLGGVIVACYVLSITAIAPRLGVGNAICFIVSGQIMAAVIIDHFGLFGSAGQTFTWQRLVGVLLMIAGLFMAKRV